MDFQLLRDLGIPVLVAPWLFSDYLFVFMNLFISSPIPPQPLPSDNHQNALCIHDSVSIPFVCLVCFLESTVDRYVFIAIFMFIILIIFFFLNKSL